MIRDLIIKDVRCFAGEQRINIRPLTFLVGENSTGKSTALGCFHILSTIPRFSLDIGSLIDFNQAPYLMGSFSDIARRDDKDNRKDFSLGVALDINSTYLEVFLEFKESGSEASLSVVTLLFPQGGKIILEVVNPNGMKDQDSRYWPNDFHIDKAGEDHFEIRIVMEDLLFLLRGFPYYLERILTRKKTDTKVSKLRRFLLEKLSLSGQKDQLDSVMHRLLRDLPEVISMAPIRSKPQRTYDPLTETKTPEGSDIPMFLMRLNRTGDKTERQIKKALADFGEQSGLFNAVDVKPYGKGMNEPFQLQVKIRGVNANILDVGYGVSQLLPILVRIFTAQSPTYFLLQQPEVHLHPRGQAELASLFITSISKQERKFIIETHSDYMVKRARIEIRNKNINPDDVALVYFEPEGNKINVHNIGFDDVGNMLNTPDSYQQFFLDESDRFLGFKD